MRLLLTAFSKDSGSPLLLVQRRSIVCGETDISLAGGTESCIGRLSYQGFSAMHSLSTHFNDTPSRACRPFDRQRNGFVMGEGAVVLVLESYESAKRRNAPILISKNMNYYVINNNARLLVGLQTVMRIISHRHAWKEREQRDVCVPFSDKPRFPLLK